MWASSIGVNRQNITKKLVVCSLTGAEVLHLGWRAFNHSLFIFFDSSGLRGCLIVCLLGCRLGFLHWLSAMHWHWPSLA